VGLTALAAKPAWPVVTSRLQDEVHVWYQLADFQFLDIHGSMGKRFAAWHLGGELIAERPLTGWGPGQFQPLVQARGSERIQDFPHVHSLYLHLLISLGLVGGLLITGVGVGLGQTVWRGWRAGHISWPFALFFITQVMVFAIVNCFDLHYHAPHTMAYLVLLSGFTMTHWLHASTPRCDSNEKPYVSTASHSKPALTAQLRRFASL